MRVVCAAAAPAFLSGCAAADRTARQDVESLQTNVQQMESSLQARQAGVYEQIRELREGESRLERLLEENARQLKAVGTQVDRLRERTQEEFDARDKRQRESSQAAAEQYTRLAARVDSLQKDLQKGFQTINENLAALGAFEKKQEERIAKMQEQFQSQLKVVVEEVGQENQGLVRTLESLRTELDAVRQESAATRQGLAELHDPLQEITRNLAAAQAQIQELSKRQEALRKAGAAAAAGARAGQHTVRAGETLTTIAARYGVGLQSLMDKNQITDANSIREGQRLAIPGP